PAAVAVPATALAAWPAFSGRPGRPLAAVEAARPILAPAVPLTGLGPALTALAATRPVSAGGFPSTALPATAFAAPGTAVSTAAIAALTIVPVTAAAVRPWSVHGYILPYGDANTRRGPPPHGRPSTLGSCPAASYSPTLSRVQYHRRWRA